MTLTAPQHVSLEGAKFVAVREACVLVAYEDGKYLDGTQRYSIGFGSQTPTVHSGDTTTFEGAFSRLREDIRVREVTLNKILRVPLTQGQFDALFSLYYQRGSGAARAVAGLFNSNAPITAISEFIRWNSGADNVPTVGHTGRRIREMMVAQFGDYGDLSRVKIYKENPRTTKSEWLPFPEVI